MDKYHVNPTTGRAGKCTAKVSCPFGDLNSDHYATAAEARKAFEAKNESFESFDAEAVAEELAKQVHREDTLWYDYIDRGFEHVREWEGDWTEAEKHNLKILGQVAKLTQKTPFGARELARAEALEKKLIPARRRNPNDRDAWRARDKAIVDLVEELIFRRRADDFTAKPATDIQDNPGLMGLGFSQEVALARTNDYLNNGELELGEVSAFQQEAISRVVRGDEPEELFTEQKHIHLVPPRERLFYKLHPKSPAFEQRYYLGTVFPVRELKEEMARAGLDGVTVSTFNNGREYGNVYSVLQPDGSVRAFSVYEHRNSDSIIINGKENWDGKELPYAADSKSVFYAEIAVEDMDRTAKTLTYFMQQAQRGELESDEELAAKAPKLDWNSILSERIPGFSDWLGKQGIEHKAEKDITDDDILKRLDF